MDTGEDDDREGVAREDAAHGEAAREDAARVTYEQVLDEVAQHRVVDAAEGVVTGAWMGELEEMRRSALQLAAAGRIAQAVAADAVRAAYRDGRTAALFRARRRLEQVVLEHAGDQELSHTLLTAVDVRLEEARGASRERARRSQSDRQRLRDAWIAAFT